MLVVKCFLAIFFVYLIYPAESTPTANYLTEGRGIGSTLWGWITYPFSWWSSTETELSINDQLIGPSSYGPYDNIEIAKRNVTVWCNDQTCTTMKCDKFGCKNITCNIYDTDMRGECREYNTIVKPEEPVTNMPTEIPNETINENTTNAHVTFPTTQITSTETSNQSAEERPLELEAILSSTVNSDNEKNVSVEKKSNKSPSPQNKV